MKKTYFNKAMLLFELFRKHKLSTGDLNMAENKANYLDGKVDEFKLLIAMCKDVFAGKYQMNKWNMSVIVATIVYVISPLDAVPDVLPIVGWLDDVTIVGYAIAKLSEEIIKYKAFKQSPTVI
jgi:uncharacterized membrane protein YkvA (DUF1232 family)